jgi:hypothetical protein
MPAGGDYKFYQNHYSDKTTDGALTSGGTVTVAPKSANHQLFVQKILVNINTHANAKTITVGDGTLTIATINDLTAAAGVPDSVLFDFGPKGRAMTLGATVTVTSQASGPVADVHIECYEKLGATIGLGDNATAVTQ